MKSIKEHFCLPALLMKLFIICAFLFPFYTSSTMNPYYPELVPSVILLFVSSLLLFASVPKTSENRLPLFFFAVFLISYDVFFLYYMALRGQWWFECLNVSLCFISLMILMCCRGEELLNRHHIIPFLFIVIILSTIAGIIVYHLGYTSVSFMNGNLIFTPHDPDYYEKRFSWFYFHKSQYCFMLLLFISLFVTYRRRFSNKIIYIASLLILLYGIYISHTFTALFASLFIFCGDIVDLLRPRLKQIKKRYFLALIPAAGIVMFFVYKMSQQRNIFSLGGRLNIWKESINQILQYTEGIGDLFGGISFEVPGLTFDVYNCHNYFLNIMYRFSLPAGLFFALLFVTLIIFSFAKKRRFLTVGIWIALLLSLEMDYALLTTDLAAAIFMLYLLFFFDDKEIQH